MTTARVTEKGQITLPKDARLATDTKTSDSLLVHSVGDAIVLENNRDWAERTSGIFAKYAKNAPPTSPDSERRWFEESVAEEVGASLDSESDD